MKDLGNYRKSYEKSELLESGIPAEPMSLFEQWFQETALQGGTEETNAMTIATIGTDGFPKSRVVLLKQFGPDGFVFYTNYNSEKGKAIANNPHVCLSFFWQEMERQVIIKGTAEKISAKQSDAYFYSRPKGSQVGAIVSNQSEIIASREAIDQKLEAFTGSSADAISRPAHWGGYIVKPHEVEFWQGRENRLHDRIRYISIDAVWRRDRLSP